MPVGVWRPSQWSQHKRSDRHAPSKNQAQDSASAFAAAVRPIHDKVANTLSPARLRFAGHAAQAAATPLAGFELTADQYSELTMPLTGTSNRAFAGAFTTAGGLGSKQGRPARSEVQTIGRLSPSAPQALRVAEEGTSRAI